MEWLTDRFVPDDHDVFKVEIPGAASPIVRSIYEGGVVDDGEFVVHVGGDRVGFDGDAVVAEFLYVRAFGFGGVVIGDEADFDPPRMSVGDASGDIVVCDCKDANVEGVFCSSQCIR